MITTCGNIVDINDELSIDYMIKLKDYHSNKKKAFGEVMGMYNLISGADFNKGSVFDENPQKYQDFINKYNYYFNSTGSVPLGPILEKTGCCINNESISYDNVDQKCIVPTKRDNVEYLNNVYNKNLFYDFGIENNAEVCVTKCKNDSKCSSIMYNSAQKTCYYYLSVPNNNNIIPIPGITIANIKGTINQANLAQMEEEKNQEKKQNDETLIYAILGTVGIILFIGFFLKFVIKKKKF